MDESIGTVTAKDIKVSKELALETACRLYGEMYRDDLAQEIAEAALKFEPRPGGEGVCLDNALRFRCEEYMRKEYLRQQAISGMDEECELVDDSNSYEKLIQVEHEHDYHAIMKELERRRKPALAKVLKHIWEGGKITDLIGVVGKRRYVYYLVDQLKSLAGSF